MDSPIMSEAEFAQLGPDLAYIRALAPEKAREMFPTYANQIKDGGSLFLLCSTTGESISLSNTFSAALGHVCESELCLVPLH